MLALLVVAVLFAPAAARGGCQALAGDDAMELAELSGHLCRAVARFEEEEMGRRPSEVRVIVEDELVLVHLKGVLSPSECDLAKTDTGQAILQRFNTLLFNSGSAPSVKQQVSEAVGGQVLDVQTTLSPLTGSLVVVFTLAEAASRGG